MEALFNKHPNRFDSDYVHQIPSVKRKNTGMIVGLSKNLSQIMNEEETVVIFWADDSKENLENLRLLEKVRERERISIEVNRLHRGTKE